MKSIELYALAIVMTLTISLPLLVSCDSQAERDTQNAANARQAESAFTLPDGRNVKRMEVIMAGLAHNHYVYFVDNTVTVNHTVKQGKTSYSAVEIFIDGVKYVPAEKS
jgi:hypothetical protein